MLIVSAAQRFRDAVGGRERILFLVLITGIVAGFLYGISDLSRVGWRQSLIGFSASVVNLWLTYLYLYKKIQRKNITRALIALLLPIVLTGLVSTSSRLESVIFLSLFPMLALMLLRLYEAIFWIFLQIVGFLLLISFDIAVADFNYIQIMQLISVQVLVTVILGTYVVSTRKLQKVLYIERDKLKQLNENLEEMVRVRTFELEEANRALLDKATTDHLTKIANRTLLFEFLEESLENFKRYGHLFSIIVFDLDFFKNINDTYGHSTGDRVLVEVVDLTKSLLRKNDLIARYGGEEFIVVLPNSEEEDARAVAEKIRDILDGSVILKERPVTASFGVCQIRENDTIHSLINCADAAMYSSKESGRNRVTLG